MEASPVSLPEAVVVRVDRRRGFFLLVLVNDSLARSCDCGLFSG